MMSGPSQSTGCSISSIRAPGSTSSTPTTLRATATRTSSQSRTTAGTSPARPMPATSSACSSIRRRVITSGPGSCRTSRRCDVLRPRITPSLLIRNGGLVKTVQFTDDKYVGDPINAVKIFNEKEADELVVLDIDASVTGAEPNLRLISQFAIECRMPLCYGGGIKTVEQARTIISLGVEKIAIASAAVENPALISEI